MIWSHSSSIIESKKKVKVECGMLLQPMTKPQLKNVKFLFAVAQCSKSPAYDFIVMIFLGKGHKIIRKDPV